MSDTPQPTPPHDPHAEGAEPEFLEDPLAKAQAELAVLQAKNADLADQFLRAKADVENGRRRAEDEVSKARKFAVVCFAESLLPVADSLEAGLAKQGHRAAATMAASGLCVGGGHVGVPHWLGGDCVRSPAEWHLQVADASRAAGARRSMRSGAPRTRASAAHMSASGSLKHKVNALQPIQATGHAYVLDGKRDKQYVLQGDTQVGGKQTTSVVQAGFGKGKGHCKDKRKQPGP